MNKRKDRESVDELVQEYKRLKEKIDLAVAQQEKENNKREKTDTEESGSEESVYSDQCKDGEAETETINKSLDEGENKENETVSENKSPTEKPLNEEIMQALGEDPDEGEPVETRLHSSIAKRWKYWSTKGVKESERDKLKKKYLRPEGIIIPKLNPEISTILSETAVKRDQHFTERQKLAVSALAALGSAIKDIAEEEDGLEIASFVEKLNDAAKFINHLVFEQTEARKAFILPMVDKQNKNVLKEVETDCFLFGKNLAARIKESKSMDKIGQGLRSKPATKKLPLQANNLNSRSLQAKRPTYVPAGYGNQPGQPKTRVYFKHKIQPFNQRVQNQGRPRPKNLGRPK